MNDTKAPAGLAALAILCLLAAPAALTINALLGGA